MNFISGSIYINLDKRTDRREQLEAQLEEYGLTAERFSAIPDEHGLIGCMKSHLAVLKLARERNWENILILEDDFEILVSPAEFEKQLQDFFSLGLPYDVVMLGYNMRGSKPFNDLLITVLDAQTTSAYLVHKRFYTTLIDLYEQTLPKLIETHDWGVLANDQVWKRLQPKSAWYAFKTRLGKQRESFSDITRKVEDYGC
jgi:glycosyl transferase family 25